MEVLEHPRMELLELSPAEPTGVPAAVSPDAPCTAEVAECSCPDFCERDHANE
jgi:hypothetical protein